MLFGNSTLSVTPMWEKDRVVLVPAIEAARLRAEGACQEVEAAQALRRFDDLPSRDRSRVREFAMAARLAGNSLHDTDEPQVHALVRAAIRDGRVKGVREGTRGRDPAANARAELRRLARAIEARGRLAHAGRRYRLVADVELARLPDRDSYEVVIRERASEILTALATEPGTDPQLGALLAQARDKLTRDWRPPFWPDGLILLRRVPTVAAAVREPAITPSQLRALAEAGWIEIEFVDPQGRPVPVICRLELPDSTRIEASDDAGGVVARHNFAPGMCRVSLPGLDAARWTVKA
jgi:hypothetical protein